eukprot:gene2396-4648_t
MSDDCIVVRSLQPDELQKWARYCSRCFESKAKPPSVDYFLDHFNNDPWGDYNGIFIAVEAEIIASTLRVFTRFLLPRNTITQIKIAGIGEVCTAVEFQRRGLSRSLLKYAISVTMQTEYDLIILHAADWIRSFYESVGFRSLRTVWTSLSFSHEYLLQYQLMLDGYTISKLNICDFADQLCNLSNVFNKKFSGPIYRNKEYVLKWINNEAKGQVLAILDGHGNPMAFAMVREYPAGIIQLRDFGIADELLTTIPLSTIVFSLISREIQTMISNGTLNIPFPNNKITIRIPQPLYSMAWEDSSDSNNTPICSGTEVIVDEGWMELKLSSNHISSDYNDTSRVFWPIDHF